MYSALSYKSGNKLNPYLVNEIRESSQEKLLLKLYEFAIMSCRRQDIEKTNKALDELIFGLRFDEQELENISTGLFRLYNFCKEQMRKREYGIVEKILTELKSTWVDALKSQGKSI